MRLGAALLLLLLVQSAFAEENNVSFYRDVVPVLKRNCFACHRAGKSKGQLDLTSFATLTKGGKHGDAIKAGNPR
ncbi:MAG: c-type cytochrome domain-containing protein, partial [Chthoniobacterales bacterium]